MTNPKKLEITYLYKRTPDYKTYHMDGVFGGITTNGHINFNIFAEKIKVPEQIINEVLPNNTLKEIKRIPAQQNEVIREVQANFIMDLATAKVVKKWIEDKIALLEAEEKKQRNKKE